MGNSTTGFSAHGGGAYLVEAAEITGSTFQDNDAANGNGGGLWGPVSAMNNTELTGNQALCGAEALDQAARSPTQRTFAAGPTPDCGKGGGAFVTAYIAKTTGSGNHIRSNHAVDAGGGLYISGGEVELQSGRVESNAAGGAGGGVYADHANVKLNVYIFDDNEAMDAGGLYANASHINTNNSVYAKNRAKALDGTNEIATSFSHATVSGCHLTLISDKNVRKPALKLGTVLPDEHGVQGQAGTFCNMLFLGYSLAIAGAAPTTTVTMSGVLLSQVDELASLFNFIVTNQYTGIADLSVIGNSPDACPDSDLSGVGDVLCYHIGPASDAIDRGVRPT